MAIIVLDQQGNPATPAASKGTIYFDSSSSAFVRKLPSGIYRGMLENNAVAQQAAYSANTYITNSDIQLPAFSMQAGMTFVWEMPVSKTAGTATPIYTIVTGANRSTADTVRLTLTGPAQTAVVDQGFIRIMVTVRTVSATATIRGMVHLQHNLAATGLAATGPAGMALTEATSGTFDNTALQGQYVGLCINPGASAAWVHEQMLARCFF